MFKVKWAVGPKLEVLTCTKINLLTFSRFVLLSLTLMRLIVKFPL